ncbi:MAG: glycosyl transferase family 1 [Chloroflexota bacterium]|nr:MAG: glycosyl transferase family 1 [Chloroflexota bacterium]
MRIGIDFSPLAYGNRTRGIGAYAENLVAALLAQDATTEYFLFTTRGIEAYELPFARAPNAHPVRLPVPPMGRATPLVSHQLILPLRARALHLDALHLIAVPYNPSTPAVPLRAGAPTVITLFDVMPLRLSETLLKNPRHRRFYNWQLDACRRAAMLLTASHAAAQDLARFDIAPREKIRVVPLAPPPLAAPTHRRDVADLADSAPFLLHVGGAEPQKDQPTVLRAFGLLCRNPAFRHNLILAGKQHGDDMPALEMSTRAARRILRLSNATRADLDLLYARCDAFIFPSLYEGFGLPTLEAMRAGAPVVTTNVAALPEVTRGASLLVEAKNPQAVANAVRRILDDERVRVTLRQAGERRAREFSWARAAELTRAVYAEVALGKKSK